MNATRKLLYISNIDIIISGPNLKLAIFLVILVLIYTNIYIYWAQVREDEKTNFYIYLVDSYAIRNDA